MQADRNIILVGFMGSGKTTVGRMLADRLGLAFIDMDELIESRQGKAISAIFAEEGEAYFRRLEHALAGELAGRTGLVISPGGGIVLNPANIATFAQTSLVVCLSATPETILSRVAHETHRPLLAGGDKLAKIKGLLDKRQALYDAVPHQIDTNSRSAAQVADDIVALYRERTDQGGLQPQPK